MVVGGDSLMPLMLNAWMLMQEKAQTTRGGDELTARVLSAHAAAASVSKLNSLHSAILSNRTIRRARMLIDQVLLPRLRREGCDERLNSKMHSH